MWLAIDPGITTGWALMDGEGRLLATSVWGTGELKQSLDAIIRRALVANADLSVVIERMPLGVGLGTLALKLAAVRDDVLSVVQQTYELKPTWVLPGTWKTSRLARTMALPHKFADTPVTVHQRDAIRMGRYAIERAREGKR